MHSQELRVEITCSTKEDFEKFIHVMRSWFWKRTYRYKILDEELVKVRFSNTSSKKGQGITFVVTYQLILLGLNAIIRGNLKRMYVKNIVKFLFSPGPMIILGSSEIEWLFGLGKNLSY